MFMTGEGAWESLGRKDIKSPRVVRKILWREYSKTRGSTHSQVLIFVYLNGLRIRYLLYRYCLSRSRMTKACVPAWPLGRYASLLGRHHCVREILREWNGANRQFPTYLVDEICSQLWIAGRIYRYQQMSRSLHERYHLPRLQLGARPDARCFII